MEIETRPGSYDAALARVDQCMAATPRKEFWLARRGDILTTAGRPAEAREACQAVLKAVGALPADRRNTKIVASLLARINERLVPAGTTR
jgi:predicted Zn-dependent protease